MEVPYLGRSMCLSYLEPDRRHGRYLSPRQQAKVLVHKRAVPEFYGHSRRHVVDAVGRNSPPPPPGHAACVRSSIKKETGWVVHEEGGGDTGDQAQRSLVFP